MLGYAGLAPFLGFAAGFAFLQDWPQALSKQGFVIYSLAILSFLGGTQWRAGLDEDNPEALARLLVSNGIVIFAVVAVLTAQVFIAVVLLMLGFLALLWYERRLNDAAPWYRTLRWRLTAGVVASQLLFLLLLIQQA
jgi:hypothetical protein